MVIQNNYHFICDWPNKMELKENEMIALITHMAFYVGWPKAVAALHIAMNDMKS